MPKLVNYTPYPNFRYYSRDNQDREFGIIVVKATYEFSPTGELVVAEEQAPMVFTDLCHGAVNVTSLWHPSDMVPYKPATDLIVNAVARVPGGRPLPSWICGVRIEDEGKVLLERNLRVTGPREWQPQWKRQLSEGEKREWQRHRRYFDRWELSEPAPITDLPLHYEYAFGGEVPQGQDDDGKPVFDTDHRNPLGRGKIDREWTDHTVAVAAPQIELASDPVSDPYTRMAPQSFGPIPPAWLPRRPLGGTYDQNWKDNVWPAWPQDYDFAYHNSANPDLILDPYLRGSERIILSGLSGWTETLSLTLPSERIFTVFLTQDDTAFDGEMVLDTIFLDIAGEAREDWRIYLSWRVNFAAGAFDRVRLYRNTPEIAAVIDTRKHSSEERSEA